MRFLVTGATGFLGQHLVRHLHGSGYETALLVREIYGLGHALPPALQEIREALQLVYADLRNLTLTRRAVGEAQPDVIVHLAAAGVTDPFLSVESALRHNVTGTINLARAAFENEGGRRLLVTRTPGEAHPTNAYQASKAATWQFCLMYANQMGWPINGATVFQAYGPGQPARTFVPAALSAAMQAEDFAMSSGGQQRDWIYVEDVVRGMAAATAELEAGASVELGTGVTHSLLDVATAIYRLVGRGGRPLPGALADRPGEHAVQVAGAQRTKQLIGWEATIALEEGLERTWRALRNQ